MTPPSLTVAREILAGVAASSHSRPDVSAAILVVLDQVAAREALDQRPAPMEPMPALEPPNWFRCGGCGVPVAFKHAVRFEFERGKFEMRHATCCRSSRRETCCGRTMVAHGQVHNGVITMACTCCQSTRDVAIGSPSVLIGNDLPGVRSIRSREDARELFGRRGGDGLWDAFGRAPPAPVFIAPLPEAASIEPGRMSRAERVAALRADADRIERAEHVSPGHAPARCIGCGKQAVLVEPDGGLPPWQCSACEIKAEQAEQARRVAIREHAAVAGLSDTWVRVQIDRGTPVEEARKGSVRSDPAAATGHGTAIPPEALVHDMLPCPFCRSTALTVGARPGSAFPLVTCDECGARGPLARSLADREAIANWNRRPIRADRGVEVRTREQAIALFGRGSALADAPLPFVMVGGTAIAEPAPGAPRVLCGLPVDGCAGNCDLRYGHQNPCQTRCGECGAALPLSPGRPGCAECR